MSGYLDVKYPFRSNLGLNPFKSWKRQWCILRPNPTSLGGGFLAVYCSEAGAAAGTVEFSASSVVRWAKSRTRPHAFAVFSAEEPRKPRILLAAQTFHDAQLWMDKIKVLLSKNQLLSTNTLLKDSFSVTVVATEFSRKCGFSGVDSTLTLSSNGLHLSRLLKLENLIEWKHINDVSLTSQNADKNRICIVTVDSKYPKGGGELKLSSPLANDLVATLKQTLSDNAITVNAKKLSKSDGDLNLLKSSECNIGEPRCNSWYCVPTQVTLDDTDLVMLKDSKRILSGPLSRSTATSALHHTTVLPVSATSLDNSTSDRRSLQSIASGIYEEIPDLPDLPIKAPDKTSRSPIKTADLPDKNPNIPDKNFNIPDKNLNILDKNSDIPDKNPYILGEIPDISHKNPDFQNKTLDLTFETPNAPHLDTEYCTMGRDSRLTHMGGIKGLLQKLEEPTYESVADCIYATMRRPTKRYPPPPLPPRLPFGTMKLGESWNSRMNKTADNNVTRHSSLGSLPRCCSVSSGTSTDSFTTTRTLPKPDKTKQSFNVFRKRLKSDSRITTLPKCETTVNIESKKKKFDFAPTRDIFKNFKVGRKMKNLKISGGLSKVGETKSCEFLDETKHVTTNRCSKSFECLEDNFIDEIDGTDLSLEFNDDAVAALQLPQEIVDIIIRGQNQLNKIRLKETSNDCGYIPITPIVPPPPLEQHYLVMSPRINLA